MINLKIYMYNWNFEGEAYKSWDYKGRPYK